MSPLSPLSLPEQSGQDRGDIGDKGDHLSAEFGHPNSERSTATWSGTSRSALDPSDSPAWQHTGHTRQGRSGTVSGMAQTKDALSSAPACQGLPDWTSPKDPRGDTSPLTQSLPPAPASPRQPCGSCKNHPRHCRSNHLGTDLGTYVPPRLYRVQQGQGVDVHGPQDY